MEDTFVNRFKAWVLGGILLASVRLPLVALKGMSNLSSQTHAATVTQPEQEKVWECVLINPERTVCYVWLHIPTGRYYKLNVEGRYEQTTNPLP